MMKRIKALPKTAFVLFSLLLSLEIFSFLMTMQPSAVVRLALLCLLLFLTIGGSRIARVILIFLLVAGTLFLLSASLKMELNLWLRVALFYAPSALMAITAAYVVLSKEFKDVYSGKYDQAEFA
jgi:hypothetical protein